MMISVFSYIVHAVVYRGGKNNNREIGQNRNQEVLNSEAITTHEHQIQQKQQQQQQQQQQQRMMKLFVENSLAILYLLYFSLVIAILTIEQQNTDQEVLVSSHISLLLQTISIGSSIVKFQFKEIFPSSAAITATTTTTTTACVFSPQSEQIMNSNPKRENRIVFITALIYILGISLAIRLSDLDMDWMSWHYLLVSIAGLLFFPKLSLTTLHGGDQQKLPVVQSEVTSTIAYPENQEQKLIQTDRRPMLSVPRETVGDYAQKQNNNNYFNTLQFTNQDLMQQNPNIILSLNSAQLSPREILDSGKCDSSGQIRFEAEQFPQQQQQQQQQHQHPLMESNKKKPTHSRRIMMGQFLSAEIKENNQSKQLSSLAPETKDSSSSEKQGLYLNKPIVLTSDKDDLVSSDSIIVNNNNQRKLNNNGNSSPVKKRTLRLNPSGTLESSQLEFNQVYATAAVSIHTPAVLNSQASAYFGSITDEEKMNRIEQEVVKFREKKNSSVGLPVPPVVQSVAKSKSFLNRSKSQSNTSSSIRIKLHELEKDRFQVTQNSRTIGVSGLISSRCHRCSTLFQLSKQTSPLKSQVKEFFPELSFANVDSDQFEKVLSNQILPEIVEFNKSKDIFAEQSSFIYENLEQGVILYNESLSILHCNTPLYNFFHKTEVNETLLDSIYIVGVSEDCILVVDKIMKEASTSKQVFLRNHSIESANQSFIEQLSEKQLREEPLKVRDFLMQVIKLLKRQAYRQKVVVEIQEAMYKIVSPTPFVALDSSKLVKSAQQNNQSMSLQMKLMFVFSESKKEYEVILVMTNTREHDAWLKRQVWGSVSQRICESVSHELGTYTNIITNVTENALEDASIDMKLKKDFFRIIHTNSLLLDNLLNDMRDYFALVNDKLEIRLARFNLKEKVCQILELFKKQLQLKKLKMKMNVQRDIPKVVLNDPQLLKQVLSNLISNSLKFTFSGEIRITLQQTTQKFIELKVEDTGIGMSVEESDRLTSMLRNGFTDEKISKNSVGLGFGLLVSNKLARLIGDPSKQQALNFQSITKQGTSFSLLIAIQASSPDPIFNDPPLISMIANQLQSNVAFDDFEQEGCSEISKKKYLHPDQRIKSTSSSSQYQKKYSIRQSSLMSNAHNKPDRSILSDNENQQRKFQQSQSLNSLSFLGMESMLTSKLLEIKKKPKHTVLSKTPMQYSRKLQDLSQSQVSELNRFTEKPLLTPQNRAAGGKNGQDLFKKSNSLNAISVQSPLQSNSLLKNQLGATTTPRQLQPSSSMNNMSFSQEKSPSNLLQMKSGNTLLIRSQQQQQQQQSEQGMIQEELQEDEDNMIYQQDFGNIEQKKSVPLINFLAVQDTSIRGDIQGGEVSLRNFVLSQNSNPSADLFSEYEFNDEVSLDDVVTQYPTLLKNSSNHMQLNNLKSSQSAILQDVASQNTKILQEHMYKEDMLIFEDQKGVINDESPTFSQSNKKNKQDFKKQNIIQLQHIPVGDQDTDSELNESSSSHPTDRDKNSVSDYSFEDKAKKDNDSPIDLRNTQQVIKQQKVTSSFDMKLATKSSLMMPPALLQQQQQQQLHHILSSKSQSIYQGSGSGISGNGGIGSRLQINYNEMVSSNTFSMRNIEEENPEEEGIRITRFNRCLPDHLQNEQLQKKVLIVDDEIFNVYSLRLILQNLGLKDHICEAYNGEQAIETILKYQSMKSKRNRFEGYQFSLIIMDVNMPILNGIECTEAIRELQRLNQLTYCPRIVGYTAFSDSETRANCFSAGMDDMLLKPSRRDDFISIIEKYYLND